MAAILDQASGIIEDQSGLPIYDQLGGVAVALPVAQVTAAAYALSFKAGLALPAAGTTTIAPLAPAIVKILLFAVAAAAGTDKFGNPYGQGVNYPPVSSVPATPSKNCLVYYKGGKLYALGPSGTPVVLATT
jgi:hypothetical protein